VVGLGNEILSSGCAHDYGTNKDLKEGGSQAAVPQGPIYRINVIKIDLPLLKDRRDDIPLLTDYFVENYCSRMNKSKKAFDPKALQVLMNHDWPGNVRELRM
jgi:DNA-binding NtrC family response regulator